jgi:chemotaxis protein MotB
MVEIKSSDIEFIKNPDRGEVADKPEYSEGQDEYLKDLNLFAHKASSNKPGSDPDAWLITFTDIMALMLTFFVLLFSMSVPEEGLFNEVKERTLDANKFLGHRNFAGDIQATSLSTKPQQAGLNLGYLSSLIEQASIDNPRMKDVTILRNADRLVLLLPDEVKFDSGRTDLSRLGQEVLRDLAGVLTNIDNQIVIIGHADPSGVDTPEDYWVNWDISLRRAQEVAMLLSKYGVEQNMIVRGISQARYKELPTSIDEAQRMSYARRVDVILRPEQAE